MRSRSKKLVNRAAVRSQINPPPFNASAVVRKVFRFQSNAALAALPITSTNLLDAWCMAVTTTGAYRLASSFRLNNVKLWGPMSSSLVPVTVSLEYAADAASGLSSPNMLRSDTSMSSSYAAHVAFAPPDKSLASNWFGRAATSPLFTVNGPINTVIDVDVSFVLQNGETPAVSTAALVAATVGTVYLRGLDGVAAATTVLPPVSYTTA